MMNLYLWGWSNYTANLWGSPGGPRGLWAGCRVLDLISTAQVWVWQSVWLKDFVCVRVRMSVCFNRSNRSGVPVVIAATLNEDTTSFSDSPKRHFLPFSAASRPSSGRSLFFSAWGISILCKNLYLNIKHSILEISNTRLLLLFQSFKFLQKPAMLRNTLLYIFCLRF